VAFNSSAATAAPLWLRHAALAAQLSVECWVDMNDGEQYLLRTCELTTVSSAGRAVPIASLLELSGERRAGADPSVTVKRINSGRDHERLRRTRS